MTDHEKRIREALEADAYLTAMAAKDDLRALLADLDGMREALQECKQWHLGDKWRDGDSTRRAAWEGHLAVIDYQEHLRREREANSFIGRVKALFTRAAHQPAKEQSK